MVAALALAIVGCSHDVRDTDTPGGTGIDTPATIVVDSGNQQAGLPGSLLVAPLVARVLTVWGLPVAGVEVTWSLETGEGALCLDVTDCREGSLTMRTGKDGRAIVWLLPENRGEARVVARSPSLPNSAALFSMDVGATVVTFAPTFDCTGRNDPVRFTNSANSSTTFMSVGTTVVMQFASWVHPDCMAHLVTTSIPAGATGFDTNLQPGSKLRFVPTVTGTFEFEDATSGGSGKLIVVP